MNTTNIYIEAANGFRLYSVLGTTEEVALVIADTLENGGSPLARFTAAFVVQPDEAEVQRAVDLEEKALPKVELRAIFADASRVRVVEQAAGWPDELEVIDSTVRERETTPA